MLAFLTRADNCTAARHVRRQRSAAHLLRQAKGYFRLAPGREVRLRYAYYVTCESVVHDDDGHVLEVVCSYDPATRGGKWPPSCAPPTTWKSRSATPGEHHQPWNRLNAFHVC